MTRLLCIGECMVELAPTEDETFRMGFAGDTFNTAWYARRLAGPDIQVGFLSAIGDDEASDRMRAFMENAGIVPHLSVRSRASVGLYMITLNDGERSFSYWRSASAARTLADDLDSLPDLAPGDIAFFSGITMAILPEDGRKRLLDAMQAARARGVRTAFDPNLRPKLWPDIANMCDWITRAAGIADMVLPSYEDEQMFFGDTGTSATAARYRDTGAATIIVKDGPRSVIVSQDGILSSVQPAPVQQIVDTTAAGDSFNAGFFVSLLKGRSLNEAVSTGCDIASKVISARGALVDV